MGEFHASHPNHQLEPKSNKKPYTCDGCKEPGIGARHRCEDCNYDLHKHCMFNKSTTRHDFFPNCTFKFLSQPPGHRKRYCDGCGKLVRGFVYHCEEKGWDLHPCCMSLPYKLKVDDVKFRLHDEVLKKCFWCKRRRLEGSVSGIRGWSYVSKCDQYHFHVYCATDMILEGWKNESYSDNSSNYNNYNNDNESLALALENLELPIQGRLRNGRSGNRFIRIVKMFFKAFVGILLGDPTIILTLLVTELIPS